MIKYSEFNREDKGNLEYILRLNKTDFVNFIKTLDDDEKEYALELMLAYDTELTLRKLESLDIVENLDDAEKVLDKFKLRG